MRRDVAGTREEHGERELLRVKLDSDLEPTGEVTATVTEPMRVTNPATQAEMWRDTLVKVHKVRNMLPTTDTIGAGTAVWVQKLSGYWARIPQPCCCRCGWLRQDWTDTTTGFFEKTHLLSTFTSSLASNADGSTIGCKKHGVSLWRVTAPQTPCLEMAVDLTPDNSWSIPPADPVGTNLTYSAAWIAGQIFPDWEFTPDGASHTLYATIDGALRYRRARALNGNESPTEIDAGPELDASIPSEFHGMAYWMASYLAAQQDGNLFVRALPPGSGGTCAEGRNGTLWSPESVTDNVTGDWCRPSQNPPVESIGNLAGNWYQVLESATPGDDLLQLAEPDWSVGASVIRFGYAHGTGMAQQIRRLPTYDSDLRYTTWVETIRLDRLCVTIV